MSDQRRYAIQVVRWEATKTSMTMILDTPSEMFHIRAIEALVRKGVVRRCFHLDITMDLVMVFELSEKASMLLYYFLQLDHHVPPR